MVKKVHDNLQVFDSHTDTHTHEKYKCTKMLIHKCGELIKLWVD